MKYSKKEFEEMVGRAVDGLPEHIQKRMENVAVCVESRPTAEQLEEEGTEKDGVLLGLFEGVPETEYGKGFGNDLPDKISIFQENIERFAQTPKEVEEEVKITVWHEIAHYFGFEDDELKKLEQNNFL